MSKPSQPNFPVHPHRVEYVLPASNAHSIEKAAESEADALFLDLEDAVAISVKAATRQTLIDSINKTDFRGKKLFVRPNNLRTKWAAGDYYHVVRTIGDKITGVALSKVVGPEDIDLVDRILTAIEAEKGWKRGQIKMEALIELPCALLQVDDIAKIIAESGRGGALIFGLADYIAATGGRAVMQEEQWTYPLYAKKRIVAAAQAYGLGAIDGITIHIKNYEATKKDALLCAKLGFTGKWSLDPEQIRAILDADKEFPFPKARHDKRELRHTVPFPLAELERLAKEERPLLLPLAAKAKTVKARRSVWLDKNQPAPQEVDDAPAYVISAKSLNEIKQSEKNLPPQSPIFLKIETREALENAYAMASALPHVEAILFAIPGYEDDYEAKGYIVAAAAALDIDAVDGVALPGKAEESARHAANMGFSGKVAVDAAQAKLYNSIFSPSVETIERALDIVELYYKADVERSLGAIVYVDKRKPNAQEELVDAATVKVERRALGVAQKAKLFTPEQEKRYKAILAAEQSGQKIGAFSISSIKRVSILGAGEIGAPLAARMARCGVQVCLGTVHLSTLTKAEKKIQASLEFRAKEATGILALEKKLAKADSALSTSLTPSPAEERATMEARIKELEPQAKELRDQWLANIKMHHDLNYNKLIATLTEFQPDFIIECTREEVLSKQSIFRAWIRAIKDLTKPPLIATTTSSLRLSEIWAPIPDELKSRFVGFHPFNPPDRMDLLELAYTPRTDPKVLEEVKLFAKSLGMETVLVKDSCSFIVNRILFAYLGEAVRMLENGEGSWTQIVRSCVDFGFPMDPFRLLDFVGLDTSEAIIANLHQAFPNHIPAPAGLFKKLLSAGREGNKSGKGFYSYSNGQKELDLETVEFFKKAAVRMEAEVDGFDPLRLPLVMIAEAARIVSEGVASIADVDLAMDLGIRFPENRGMAVRLAGGVFALTREKSISAVKALYAKTSAPRKYASGPWGWALRYGIENVVDHLEALSLRYGALYKPAEILKDLRYGFLPKPEEDGKYRYFPYKRVFVKPNGVRGPATEVFEEGVVPTQKQLGAYQMRARVIVADINANWKWGVRDYPIDLAKYHTETGTVGGSTGLVLITEVGSELSRVGTVKPGDIGIMLCGKHDVITLEALGGSAQANRNFRIHGYEAKDPLEGSYGQEVVLDWSQFVRVDEGVYTFEELGGIGLVYPTVQHSWNVLNLQGGNTVLVEGAVGGTGATAVLTAKSRGAKVIGMVSSESRAKLAREKYGCDETIDRTQFKTDEAYTAQIKRLVKKLTGKEELLDKVLVYSGQGMFARHFLSLRESDPLDIVDLGGELTYFGAGETGFALEVPGTAKDSSVSVMFKRIARVRSLRYRIASMRYVLIVAGPDIQETKEAIVEAKRRHCDVIVLVENGEQARAVKELNVLAVSGRWPKSPCRDGVVDLSAINVKIEKMPEPPVILPDNPTPGQIAEFDAKAKEYAAYMRRSLIPFGKALGAIWGVDASGRPIPTDAAIILRNDQLACDILNYITFTGFFSQIAYVKDTSKLRLRWHAALGWMNQNSVLLSTKAILGSHYASPNESAAIIDWIMRGVLPPAQTRAYMPAKIGEAQEAIGTGKNVVLIGVSRPHLKTLQEAYSSQEVTPSLEGLVSPQAPLRELAAQRIYEQGFALAQKAASAWMSDAEFRELILGVPIVGIAVEPQRFDEIHAAWGKPELARVPEAQQAREFTIQAQGALIDVLTPLRVHHPSLLARGQSVPGAVEGGEGPLAKFLRIRGEGIQQIEFAVTDVDKATQWMRKRGFTPVYESPREGANGTRVNFFLIGIAGTQEKALIEFFQIQSGMKAALSARVMRDLDIRIFAKASGDRNPFHLDDAYAAKTSYGVRIAHGVLTAGITLSKLAQFAPGYGLEAVEVSRFTQAVKIGDTVASHVEVLEAAGDTLHLKLSAVNQEGKLLYEGSARLKARHTPIMRPENWSQAEIAASVWARDVRAFEARPAPEFKPKESATYRPDMPDSRCLKITLDTIKAYGAIFGGNQQDITAYAVIGAVAHTSAMFAPGYILAGFKCESAQQIIEAGTSLHTQAWVDNIQTTSSGRLLVKIGIQVFTSSGQLIGKGEVTKIKVAVGEPTKEGAKSK